MSKSVNEDGFVERPPIVVELVGLTAAGKTSLARGLAQSDERFVDLGDIFFKRRRQRPFLVRNIHIWLPVFLRQWSRGRWFNQEDIKTIVHLKTWQRVLNPPAASGAIVILDHGPIYMLTRLHAFGPENLKHLSADEWWEGMIEPWSHLLHMAIWLDAPDEILLDRIHARRRWHILKEKDDAEGYEFLARYRMSYSKIISALTANWSVRLLRFDTHKESMSQVINRVLAELDLAHRQDWIPAPYITKSSKDRV